MFIDPLVLRQALAEEARAMREELENDAVDRLARYHDDPVGFMTDILGIKPWSRQAEILAAVAAEDRVLVRSGHKIGKSLAAVALALWFVATRKKARVMMTAPTSDQVKKILWRELTDHYPPIATTIDGPARMPRDPATGLKLNGGREIFGKTANKIEALAGVSGAALLFIIDEASGFDDDDYEVIKGNTAGGAKIVGFSNPTRSDGWFYDGFHNGLWHAIHVSSEETPNVTHPDHPRIPGLATRGYIDEMRVECGAGYDQHPMYQVRVLGEFPSAGPRSVFGLDLVEEARKRWNDHVRDFPHAGLEITEIRDRRARDAIVEDGVFGHLSIGVDPKRYGDDDCGITALRGKWIYRPHVIPPGPLTGDDIAEATVMVARALRRRDVDRRPTPVKVDGKSNGAAAVDALRRHEAHRKGEITVVEVDVSRRAPDESRYMNIRAQHWFEGAEWVKDGGCLPPDPKLTQELLAVQYQFDEKNRLKVQRKDDIRKALKRSPNRADSLLLATWSGDAVELRTTTKLPEEEDDGPGRGLGRRRRAPGRF